MTTETKVYNNYPAEAVVIEQKMIFGARTVVNVIFLRADEVSKMVQQMIDSLSEFHQMKNK